MGSSDGDNSALTGKRSSSDSPNRPSRPAERIDRLTEVAFGREIAPTLAKTMGSEERRAKRQTARVRSKLLGVFEIERQRLSSADAVGTNNVRKALRESANTADLRDALDFVERQGTVSSLTLLQMKCSYMDSPGWLEAQIASSSSRDSKDLLAELELQRVKEVRVGLRRRQHQHMLQVQRALIGVLQRHLGHIPLPECLRRWKGFARLSRAIRDRDEKAIRQADTIVRQRAAKLEAWQARTRMCPTVNGTITASRTPKGDVTEKSTAEDPAFGIGNIHDKADTELPVPEVPMPGTTFPSSELQLQLIACRHTSAEVQRKLLAQLQRNTCTELLRSCACRPDGVANAAQTWLEKNGVTTGAPVGSLNFAAQVPTVITVPHPPALARAVEVPESDADVAPKLSGKAHERTGNRPEISIVFRRPLRTIDEAVVTVATSESFGHAIAPRDAEAEGKGCLSSRSSSSSSRGRQQKQQQRRQQQNPSLIHILGMRFDTDCEELLEIVDGSAAAEVSRSQRDFRPGLFLTHVQGTTIRSAAVNTTKLSAGREHARVAQVTQELKQALTSGEPLQFGFTSQPLHVYRVLHKATAAVASVDIRRPNPPTSPATRSRSSSPVHVVSRPRSTDGTCSCRALARPGSASARPRPLGKVCRPKRPASAKPDYGRSTDVDVEEQCSSTTTQQQQRDRPATAPPATLSMAPSCRINGGSSLHMLGTVSAEGDGGATWSYADYTAASMNATGPPGTRDKPALVSSIEWSSIDVKQRPTLIQKQKQRARQWDTSSSSRENHGNALRDAAATSAFRREASTDVSSRDARKHSGLFKWQAPADCVGRRSSDSGAIIAWSNQPGTTGGNTLQ